MRDRIQRLRDINRTQLGIVLAALVLGITIVFPRFYPAAKRGPTCSSLAQPLGGNNRSVLAYNSNQTDNLKIDLELDSDSFRVGQSLTVRVSFRNEDQGAMILYLPNQNPVPVNLETEGIYFELTAVNPNRAIGQQGTVIVSPPSYTGDNLFRLHLLGSRARCHQDFTFDAATLSRLGVNAGIAGEDYRIRAFYRVASDGNLLDADVEKNAGLTPTSSPFPEYLDSQGVWTGTVSSKEERFSIRAQPTPAPAAPPAG